MQQKFFAVGSANAGDQLRLAVFDPLMLGFQKLDGLGIESRSECAVDCSPQVTEEIAHDIRYASGCVG